jgi:hypothetical protein
MSKRRTKRRNLENTVAAIQKQYGPQALHRGSERSIMRQWPHIPTGFKALDAITGCGGVPLGATTIFSGQTTSGKLTLAFKALAGAQQRSRDEQVAILDLTRQSDPDYLARCGVDLDHLLIARPSPGPGVVDLLVDLLRSRQLRFVLVDSLVELMADRPTARRLNATLGLIDHTLREAGCALLFIDDPAPPWNRWALTGWLVNRNWPVIQRSSLHVECRRERWLRQEGDLVGYQAEARVLRSRWAHGQPVAPVEIRFNGTVQAHSTW